jgi:hypothetical protein
MIDCILLKSPGVVKIHRNTALKYYYQCLLMSEAETTKIHGDQRGGRFGSTAPVNALPDSHLAATTATLCMSFFSGTFDSQVDSFGMFDSQEDSYGMFDS